MSDITQSPHRTVKQILDAQANPLPATATSNLWIGRKGVFSKQTEGNCVAPFTSGKAYYADLIATLAQAEQEICILGWQVAWDALLAPETRLYDVLLKAAAKNVSIYVMPWDDTNPVQTYDDQTKAVLESINDHPSVKYKRVRVVLSQSMATKNNNYFSHHQKMVVVDRKFAFVGGIDLTYGRYDDDTFDLTANADGREVLNRYNPCIPWMKTLHSGKGSNLVDPDLLSGLDDVFKVPFVGGPSTADETIKRIQDGGWQVPYSKAGKVSIGANHALSTKNSASSRPRLEQNTPDYTTLDPASQPRMPWQDFHSRIEGPAVSDLLRNFVARWNACGGKHLALPKKPGSQGKAGTAIVQVLRSAPENMGKREAAADPGLPAAQGTEDDIYQAWLLLIEKSSRFIYIENQFFVSDFGKIGGPTGALSPAARFINFYNNQNQNEDAGIAVMADDGTRLGLKSNGWTRLPEKTVLPDASVHALPKNQICAALIARIGRAIMDRAKPKYHVYVTLPVHPEGSLADASIAVQVYWTMQTISFGSRSLLNGIRRWIKACELRDKGDTNFMRVVSDDDSTEYQDVPDKACFEYVTLLNLRNWAKLGTGKNARYVTEQIYVHSKLIIVDDLYALYGSANINDRSMLGERDSELAVLVMDTDSSRADINGKGSNRPVRKFAHELRIAIWKKLFGISGNVRPATHLLSAIEAPGMPDSWRRIQEQAKANAEIYESVFAYIPGKRVEHDGNLLKPSIIPTWNREKRAQPSAKWGNKGMLESPMPFQPEFWRLAPQPAKTFSALNNIKGFITALPVRWTEDENIRFDYPTSLVAENEVKGGASGNEQLSVAAADNRMSANLSSLESSKA